MSRRESVGWPRPAAEEEGNEQKPRLPPLPPASAAQSATGRGCDFQCCGRQSFKSGSLAAEDFVDFGRQLEIQVADALHAVGIQINHHFVLNVEPFRMVV